MAKKNHTVTTKPPKVASQSLDCNFNLVQIIGICLLIYILSRLIIVIEYSSINLILNNHKPLVDNLWRWDSGIYADIAKGLYSPTVADPNRDLWPWFPMWPIVLRICSFNLLFPLSYTALVTNQMLFFVSLILLWLYLAQLQFSSKNIIYGVTILAISPANIYFCSGLSEPLFLCLSLAIFYFLSKNKMKYVLALAFCLSATRMTGEFIILPVIYHLYKTKQLSIKKCIIYIPIMSGGLILFMVYLKIVSNDWLKFLHAEYHRGREIMDFSQIIDKTITIMTNSQIYDSTIFVISLFLITFLLFRAKLIKEAIFNLSSILPGYISGSMWNSFRFDTAIFPFYIGLTVLATKSDIYKYMVITILSVMSYICWFYWLCGSWYFA